MGKEIAKKAGLAAVESTLQALMPELLRRFDQWESRMDERFEKIDERFEKIDERFEKIETKISDLRNEMLDKFESTRDLINEVAQRIHAVGALTEAFKPTSDRQETRLDGLIERTGFLQGALNQKRRKAG